MTVNIVQILGLCISASVICKLLEKYQKEQAVFVSIMVCVTAMVFIVVRISPVLNTVDGLFSTAGLNPFYVQIIFKAVGVCWLTQLACDICKDCGENAICSIAELTGKITLLLLAMPLLKTLAETVQKLTG